MENEPQNIYIQRTKDTERLYNCEERVSIAIMDAARELGRVLGHDEDEFWSRTMPQALFDILDNYHPAGEGAVRAYLRAHPDALTPRTPATV